MTQAAELARLRQGLYRFFGGALAPPEQVRLEQLRESVELLESMDLVGFAFYREWRPFAAVLESGATVANLAPEYVRLFASGTKGVLCPPIESFYRSNGRREAIAEIVTEIQDDYRALGLTTTTDSEAPDHATTQLEIMSTLAARESAAWEMQLLKEAESVLEAEDRFSSRHLALWIPHLRARVHSAGPNDFYAAYVDALHAFVIHDKDIIAGLRRWSGVGA